MKDFVLDKGQREYTVKKNISENGVGKSRHSYIRK